MSSKNIRKLGRWALDTRLAPLRKIGDAADRPERGWIKAIREALGMTTGQFAKRLGVSQPRVAALEKAEANDAVTLKSLRQAAEALDCRLVYALIPNTPLEEAITRRARLVAERLLARTSHTMRLENQAVSGSRQDRALDELAKTLAEHDRRLWEDA